MACQNQMNFGNLSFGFGQQPKQEEKPPFQINEQMLLTDIPSDVVKEFIDVHKKIVETRTFLAKEEQQKQSNENSEDDSTQKTLLSIRDESTSEIFGSLTSLAHQIDAGKKTVKEFEEELAISKSDYTNSEHIRSLPSPFILRFVDRVEKSAEDFAQSIAAYGSHLQPNKPISNENQIIFDFLNEQHNAILRCSSRVSKLNEKLIATRNNLATKLKINSINISNFEESAEDSYAQSIDVKYQQFLGQQKQKNQKRIEESDLFGNSTVEEQTTSGGFGFGGGFGNSFGSGFGSSTSSFGKGSTTGKKT
ncbi:hypothetical protein TRFO_20916 [Tritrichomonas foetus]|uniref:Uncharacterized protein n=1 Tax=Tritrichomonas foetus TaxID=1144522 RepID=A0A1J4KKV3_9EUKA|nr:hypothetical protein TRFO_20916 [Tritrichomonas foetus]|eukprot:OHT10005.1 hypothetical protein TRFO_20916 [Tritrichomonas foetus]